MSDKASAQYQQDVSLESEAKRLGDYPLHPVISKVTSKSGLFNMIRNARNKNQVDIEKIGEAGG